MKSYYPQCRICENNKNNKIYNIREMMFGSKEVFQYFQCSNCQCLQIKTIPENISEFYPENYYSYDDKAIRLGSVKRYLLKIRNKYLIFGEGFIGKILHAKFPGKKLDSLRSVGITRKTRILDVGCGSGVMLYFLRDIGIENILGIDPYNKADINYDNGLIVRRAQISDISDKWDLVMFHHSFEHMSDPLRVLRNVAKLLSSDGRCIIRIPTVSSFAWQHYGVNWVQLDAPRHIFLHSVTSINLLAEQSGLEVENVVYDSTEFQFVGSEGYKKDISLWDERMYSRFSKSEINSFLNRANELNINHQGDQAIFYLRKSTSNLHVKESLQKSAP